MRVLSRAADATVDAFKCTCSLTRTCTFNIDSTNPLAPCFRAYLKVTVADLYQDLVSCLHIQSDSWIIYVLSVAFHGSLILMALLVLYAKKTQKRYITTLLSVPTFNYNYSSLWSNWKTKIINFNQIDGITMSDFITNLDPHKKVLLLLRGLSLPFDDASVVSIKRFVASSLVKFINCEKRSYVSLRHHG